MIVANSGKPFTHSYLLAYQLMSEHAVKFYPFHQIKNNENIVLNLREHTWYSMKILIQRVKKAEVVANGDISGAIKQGLVMFIGFAKGDEFDAAKKALEKIKKLRIFSDPDGLMNLSLQDTGGELLIVSQFTLCAAFKSGNRPGFDPAMPPKEANKLYDHMVSYAKTILPGKIATGIFGADMQVSLVNDGPCTFVLDF